MIDELKNSYKREAPSGVGAGLKTYAVLSAIEAAWKYNQANKQHQQDPNQPVQNPSFMQYLVAALFSGWGWILAGIGVIGVILMIMFIVGSIVGLDSGEY